VIFAGYSQGGHAALWADELAGSYAPDVRVAGVIGFAAATDLIKTFYDTGAGTRTTWIPPYIYAGYDDYYDLKTPAGSLFKEPYAANIASDARAYCIDQVETLTGHYGTPATIANYYQPEFLESLKTKTLSQKFPELANLLIKNRAGTAATSAPKLVLGGKKDNVITESAQIELIKLLCSHQTANVQAELYPEGNHYTTMSLGWPRVLLWLDQIQSNQLSASHCGGYR
jgi:pimeloyl-ACP methyl ester carboxylesterase